MNLIRSGCLAAFVALASVLSPAQAEDDYPVGTVSSMWWPQNMFGSYRHWDQIFAVRTIARGGAVSPLEVGEPLAEFTYDYRGRSRTIADYMERNRVTGLLAIHDGVIRLEQYAHGADETSLFASQSVAKSIVSTLVGRAIHDGLIASVTAPLDRYVPELARSGYAGVPIEAALQMSSGIAFSEDYDDPNSAVSRMWELASTATSDARGTPFSRRDATTVVSRRPLPPPCSSRHHVSGRPSCCQPHSIRSAKAKASHGPRSAPVTKSPVSPKTCAVS